MIKYNAMWDKYFSLVLQSLIYIVDIIVLSLITDEL